jgi:hypothetical protein
MEQLNNVFYGLEFGLGLFMCVLVFRLAFSGIRSFFGDAKPRSARRFDSHRED